MIKAIQCGFGLGAKKVATAAPTVTREVNPVLKKAQSLWGGELAGVRGNVAIVRGKAPWNNNVTQTSFFDMSTATPTWLKTKQIGQNLDYLPFGISSAYARIPEGVVKATQRRDAYPEIIGAFDRVNSYKTTFFTNWGSKLRVDNVKTRTLAGTHHERKVMSGFQKPNGEYAVHLEPVTTPANGTVRGGAANIGGETTYYTHKGLFQ